MDDLILEPVAVIQEWSVPEGEGQWEMVIAEFLQHLAHGCALPGKTVIGHIKALALFDQSMYLRASIVAADRPALLEGNLPPGCRELKLTLNVLVYGLKAAQLTQIIQTITEETASRRRVIIKNHFQDNQHTHHSIHDQKENTHE